MNFLEFQQLTEQYIAKAKVARDTKKDFVKNIYAETNYSKDYSSKEEHIFSICSIFTEEAKDFILSFEIESINYDDSDLLLSSENLEEFYETSKTIITK